MTADLYDEDQVICQDFSYLDVLHVIPPCLMERKGEDSDMGVENMQTVYKIQRMLDPDVIESIKGSNINRPSNALTMDSGMLALNFRKFQIRFEQVVESTTPHTYKIDSSGFPFLRKDPVTRTLYLMPDESIESLSPALLSIHCSIGRILNLSGAKIYTRGTINRLQDLPEDAFVSEDGHSYR
ncbi:conserved hypothetical protein [Talaromyces stipitatus ATCC 10500]|uniref:Uncharacterized protein n=1 Tax=Talaromyces stipitatus (strain ATCC 10500 / CBS 375.48 / QM 6759 / NRRL 1006) TaxID=441959 RepID=B8MRI1_TALSN|nr:uncharacterized protein TSTA_056170 [Talaromyces stipitatus ATCC 10500]EED13118.1 conserved hypothetical protein [Talaromyces stipitatus ATCC 10500]